MKRAEKFRANDAFDLEESIIRYSNHIAADIKSKKRRHAVAEEYAAHIEDAVYHKMLSGISERDAFFAACEDLGEPAKLQEMLACVHNRPPLPSYVRWLVIGFLIGTVATLYFLIENTVFRAWVLLFLFTVRFAPFAVAVKRLQSFVALQKITISALPYTARGTREHSIRQIARM